MTCSKPQRMATMLRRVPLTLHFHTIYIRGRQPGSDTFVLNTNKTPSFPNLWAKISNELNIEYLFLQLNFTRFTRCYYFQISTMWSTKMVQGCPSLLNGYNVYETLGTPYSTKDLNKSPSLTTYQILTSVFFAICLICSYQ